MVDTTLHMDCAKDQWDDLLRGSASIGNGTVSAVLVLQRFGSAAQGDRLYRTAKTLGRLLRTILSMRLLYGAGVSARDPPRAQSGRVGSYAAATSVRCRRSEDGARKK